MSKGVVIELSPMRTRATVYIDISGVFETWKIKLRRKDVELGDEITFYDEDKIYTRNQLYLGW